MSNFAFLKTPEWQTIYQDAARAEQYVLADARTALFYGRRTVELMVEWLYAYDPAFRRPYDDNLAALMTDTSFKRQVPPGVQDKMHALRILGNEAVHQNRLIKQAEAVAMIRDLFRISHWFGRTYTQGDPNTIPNQFHESKLPPPPRQVAQQSRAQLKELADAYLKQDEELRQQHETVAALKAELAQLRAQVATTKIINEAIPDSFDYTYTEAETRQILIDVLLREAGWQIADARNPVFDKNRVSIEEKVTPMPNRQGFGYADYVLWGADGLPLAVIEAKKSSVDKEAGQQQAKLYADALEQMHGRRPLIFYTNGYTISLWDDEFYPPRDVQGFYTADELHLLIQRRQTAQNLAQLPVNTAIVNRYYQEAAIRHVTEQFSQRHRHALLVMATGTGKTRTAVALIDLLMRANWVKRVLFLADRTTLVRQAVKAFKSHLPTSNPINLLEDKEARESRVVVSTYHTILNQIEASDETGQRLFSPGHFDLIIIDEAHRSVYQKFSAIFAYFDSLLLGLTATPKDEVDRNTYRLFKLEEGVPTYAYHLEEAVPDGFLVPPILLEADTKFLREGIHYDDLTDAEKEEWDRIEWDDSGSIPDAIESAALNQWLFNEDTVDKVLQTLMAHGHKVAGGDRLGKTIIFAKNHKHAEFIATRFNHHYPHYRGDFARVIDNTVNYAQDLIEKFGQKENDPHIAISVDMLDTGVDVPEVVNLVFFKPVRSKTKFFQMIGRGTRLCPELFGPDQDKENFYIFDFCGNFEFFRYHPQGQPEARLPQPLRQRLFVARLELLAELRNRVSLRNPVSNDLEPLAQQTAADLHGYVAAMNLDNFLVRPARPYVEPFQNPARWQTLTRSDLADLHQHVAHLPSQLADDPETAKRFDVLIFNLQLALLRGESKAIEPLRNRIIHTAVLLNDKGSIPAVQARMPLIQQLQTESYWQDVTVPQLEDVRRALRGLTQFIERQAQKGIITDFTDQMGELRPGWLPDISDGVNKAQYRKKVEQFIRANEDAVVIHKIRWAIPLTPEDLAALDEMLFSAEEVGSEAEFAQAFGAPDNLATFVRGLVGLNREAAKRKFARFLDDKTYNADQIQFVNFIIEHLTRNGTMPPDMLWERPFVDIHDAGPTGLFSDTDADALLAVIEEVNGAVRGN
ncbi:MAG: restriction endonuclease subunit R [Chloroflexota bacterium]|nr:MAG: restriction endonuclease subunit R [Chloroflexota bacterium]